MLFLVHQNEWLSDSWCRKEPYPDLPWLRTPWSWTPCILLLISSCSLVVESDWYTNFYPLSVNAGIAGGQWVPGAFQPQVRKALDKNHVFIRDSRQRCWSCRPAGERALLHEHGQTEDGPDKPPFLGLLLSPGEQFSPLLTAWLQCSGLAWACSVWEYNYYIFC